MAAAPAGSIRYENLRNEMSKPLWRRIATHMMPASAPMTEKHAAVLLPTTTVNSAARRLRCTTPGATAPPAAAASRKAGVMQARVNRIVMGWLLTALDSTTATVPIAQRPVGIGECGRMLVVWCARSGRIGVWAGVHAVRDRQRPVEWGA